MPRSRDRALWVATIGNTLVALPAPYGLFLFSALLLSPSVSERGWDFAALAKTLAVGAVLLGPILLGLYFVVGYWRAALGGKPSARPDMFWRLSAGYNVAAAALWGTVIVLGWGDNPAWFFPVLGLVWAGFMVTLSVRRTDVSGSKDVSGARASPASSDDPRPAAG